MTVRHNDKSMRVDVSILVDDLRFNLGDWINVIGYHERDGGQTWIVRGVMVWPVPPGFDLVHYENAVKARTETIF